MERSSSAFKASTSGEDFTAESGGAAKRSEPGARKNRAQSVAQGRNRRFRKTGVLWFKRASLRIRQKVQRFSVRHRPWETKRRVTARSGKDTTEDLDGFKRRRVAKGERPGRDTRASEIRPI